MNPYEAPQPEVPPSPLHGPSRGFWLALGCVFVGLVIILAIPFVQKLREEKRRHEARDNLRQLRETLEKYEQQKSAP